MSLRLTLLLTLAICFLTTSAGLGQKTNQKGKPAKQYKRVHQGVLVDILQGRNEHALSVLEAVLKKVGGSDE